VSNSRVQQKQATALALRAAAVRLMADRGYDATSTDDIARAAGVSPRTFFNYFPTKESVVPLPADFLPGVVERALRARPAGEDVLHSLVAAALATVDTIATLPGAGESMAATVRLMFDERQLRQIFLERQTLAEERAWDVLRDRGVAANDLATRVALATVTSLTYLALRTWAEGDGTEPLIDIVGRCLALTPDPTRVGDAVQASRNERPARPT
jgi:AcrR family transcriptional regulator